jgi:hypothetical protein
MDMQDAGLSTNTAPDEPEDDLRATIAKAVESSRAAAEGEPPEVKSEAAQTARDEQGRFKAQEEAAQQQAAIEQPAQAPVEGQQQAAIVMAPPRGWSPASKAAFDALPENIKADIAKREADVDRGFAKYRGLDRHVQEFEANGVALPDAIANYRAAEDALTNDFTGGIDGLCQHFDVHPLDLAQELINRYGEPQQAPQQHDAQGQPIEQPYYDPRVADLEQRLNGYEQHIQAQREGAVQTDIEKFLADPSHKFADNVIDQMVGVINGAKSEGRSLSLKEAYDAACWLNPETRQLLINEQIAATSKSAISKASKAASQAKAAAASVTGSPISGVSTDGGSPRSLRDDIKQALDASMGRV